MASKSGSAGGGVSPKLLLVFMERLRERKEAFETQVRKCCETQCRLAGMRGMGTHRDTAWTLWLRPYRPATLNLPAKRCQWLSKAATQTTVKKAPVARQKTPSAGVFACTSPPEIQCLLYISPGLYVTSNTLRSSRSLSRKEFSHLPAPSQLTSPGPQQE